MTAIPVDIIMRSNFRETRGGDVAQIENSLAPLNGRVDVRYVAATAGMILRPNAIHHLVNVDRPLDFLAARRRCGPRVLVSAIHHSLPRIAAMQCAVNKGRAAGFLPAPLRERLAFTVRASRSAAKDRVPSALARTARVALAPADMWRRVGHALDGVAHVALLAEQERSDLMVDTGWHGRNGVIIPNGRPPKPAIATPWHSRPRGIVVVGRIEPRKRQLQIAQAAANIGMMITFVGPAMDDDYGLAFRALTAASPIIEWLGGHSAEDTVALIATSRVLLNASWVEVQSLVDIEAATAGCWVVTSPTGSSREWLGPAVDRIDSDDPAALLARAHQLASGNIPPPPTTYKHDWLEAGERLLSLYAGLVPHRSQVTT